MSFEGRGRPDEPECTGTTGISNEEKLDRFADALAASHVYRVLRRLDVDRRLRVAGDNAETAIGVVIDIESTSLDTASCRVIELSLRRLLYDMDGRITKLDNEHSWLEDPGEPLDPKISTLTGLTDDDLRGRAIDECMACAIISSAALRIAFNAASTVRSSSGDCPQSRDFPGHAP